MRYMIADPCTRQGCNEVVYRTWTSMSQYHACCGNNPDYFSRQNKLRVFMMFQTKPVDDDVFNLAYVQGTAEKNIIDDASKANKAVSSFIDISNKLNEPLIRRNMEKAVTDVLHATYIITRTPIDEFTSLDNYLPHKGEVVIEMEVNEDFSDTEIIGLRNNIHDYIVSKILFEWANLTYPKFAEHWKSKMEEDIKLITECTDRDRFGREEHITPTW